MNPRANLQNFQGDTGGLAEFLSNLFRSGIRTNADARAGGGAHLSAPAPIMNSTFIPSGPGPGGTSGLPQGLVESRVNPMDILAQVQDGQASVPSEPIARSNADFMASLVPAEPVVAPKATPKKKNTKKSSTKRKAKRKSIVPAAPIKNEVQAAINNASGVPSGPSHKDRLAMLNAGYGADEDFGITY